MSLPQLASMVERTLMGMSRLDQRPLRRSDLPFGFSVVVATSKPDVHQLQLGPASGMSAASRVRSGLRDVS
jgi:hypothetical protein